MDVPRPGSVTPGGIGPDGYSYGAVLVRADARRLGELTRALSGIRFTGWIAPPQGEWLVAITPTAGVVAAHKRGIFEVGEVVARDTRATVVALRVLRDRQLGIAAWRIREELLRYCSDPSREPNADRDVLADPVGAEYAAVLAGLVGRPLAEDQLSALLADPLDPFSVFESERLAAILRLLGLPEWIVATGSLPRDIPTGPRVASLTRLRAGAPGVRGRVRNIVIRRFRASRVAPAVIEDPPRESGMDIDPWLL